MNIEPTQADQGGDDLVTALTCASEFEAQTKIIALKEAGIEAFSFGAVHSALPLDLKALRVPVQVRAADLDRARAELAQIETQAAGVDWDSVDVGEREDDLPMRKLGHMPLVAKIGFVLAMVILATMLGGIAWSAIVAIFSKW